MQIIEDKKTMPGDYADTSRLKRATLIVGIYQIRGRRTGRKQEGLHKETTPTNEGW